MVKEEREELEEKVGEEQEEKDNEETELSVSRPLPLGGSLRGRGFTWQRKPHTARESCASYIVQCAL